MKTIKDISGEVFLYMKRHFTLSDDDKLNQTTIHIGEKNRYLFSNKKRIKKRMYAVIEKEFESYVDGREKIGIVMKTIKEFIDQIRKIKKGG